MRRGRRVSCLEVITTHESPAHERAEPAESHPTDRPTVSGGHETRLVVVANLQAASGPLASFRSLIHVFRGENDSLSTWSLRNHIDRVPLSYRLCRATRLPGTPGGCTWGTSCARAWAGTGSPSWGRREGPRRPATRCCTRCGTPCSAAAP